jgi:hypothetical protein
VTDIEKILSCIGQPVRFTYPEGIVKIGILTDRSVTESGYLVSGDVESAFYWDVIDLIDFEGDTEPMMRITYYRKLKGRLVFAGQTTITEPISTWKRMLLEAIQKKSWFRELLQEVMSEVEN